MNVPGGIPLVPKQPQSCSKHTKAAAQVPGDNGDEGEVMLNPYLMREGPK